MAQDNGMVGVRLPGGIIDFIDMDVASGDFLNRSEWVRVACREFYEKRKQDRQGGGGP